MCQEGSYEENKRRIIYAHKSNPITSFNTYPAKKHAVLLSEPSVCQLTHNVMRQIFKSKFKSTANPLWEKST